MKKERIVRIKDVMGFSPAALHGQYTSRLVVEDEGVGSSKLMLAHCTVKPGTSSGPPTAHPPPYDETYYILRGRGLVEFGEGEAVEAYPVESDTAVFIPGGTKHKITNVGDEDLVLLAIWPIMPREAGINPVCDERLQAWGTTFRKVGDPSAKG